MSAQQPKDEMSFLDHLEELRWHLIRSVIAILIVAIVAFIFKDFIFDVILFGPKQKDFVTYRWFCSISQTLGQGSSFCIDDLPFRIQSRTMAGQFSAHLWTSILAGFIIAFPYIIFEFWKFISPGLYEKERKLVLPILISSSLLFYLGAAFAYFVVFPLIFTFFISIAPDGIAVMTDISRYLDFVITLFFAFGFAFEVPIVTVILVLTNVSTPKSLSTKRPYVIVGAFIVGMLLTPPDVISQTLLAIPIWLLYEIGIIFARMITKNRHAVVKETLHDNIINDNDTEDKK